MGYQSKDDLNLQTGNVPAPSSGILTPFDNDGQSKAEVLDRRTVRGLKSRHAQMIAIGGTIGTGAYLVESSNSLFR